MAVEGSLQHIGFLLSGADYSNAQSKAGPGGSGQFLAVIASTAADLTILLSGANGQAIGILQNKPKLGDAADVGYGGVSKAVYGGAVTRGDLLKSDASGKLVTGGAGSDLNIARALESGADTEIHSVFVFTGLEKT